MVYSIAFDAVKYKIERFDPPAVLINEKELAVAINMGYKEAGIEIPDEIKETDPKSAKEKFLQDVSGTSINEKLLHIIKEYPPEMPQWPEDAVTILNL